MKDANAKLVAMSSWRREKLVSTGRFSCGYAADVAESDCTKSSNFVMFSLEGDTMFTEYLDPLESVNSMRTLVCLLDMGVVDKLDVGCVHMYNM